MSDEVARPGRWRRYVIVFVCTVSCILFSWFLWKVYTTRQYRNEAVQLRSTIDALQSHGPADVPASQWKDAVAWTSNLVVQDFFSPNPEQFIGLQKLNQQLEQKKGEPVDLAKLRWIWDEIEAACGGPDSVAARFRNVKLMTNGPITDERLPSVWALDRCVGLDLSETQITDASAPFLLSLPKIERLDISKTFITPVGVAELQSSRPELHVFHESIPK